MVTVTQQQARVHIRSLWHSEPGCCGASKLTAAGPHALPVEGVVHHLPCIVELGGGLAAVPGLHHRLMEGVQTGQVVRQQQRMCSMLVLHPLIAVRRCCLQIEKLSGFL
jgi:hypothetical protein